MRRLSRALGVAIAVSAAAALPLTAQSVTGTWDFQMQGPDGTEVTVIFTFEQDGEDVTGSVDLSAIPEVQAAQMTEGVFEDGILFFVLEVGADGQWIPVEVEAEVDGDEMKGEAYMAEMGQVIPFTGKRRPG